MSEYGGCKTIKEKVYKREGAEIFTRMPNLLQRRSESSKSPRLFEKHAKMLAELEYIIIEVHNQHDTQATVDKGSDLGDKGSSNNEEKSPNLDIATHGRKVRSNSI